MKVLYLFIFLCSGIYGFAQNINFTPANTHYFAAYTVQVSSSNATLYYTLDGATPTLASSSAVGSFSVNIDQNKTIKVFAVDTLGNSSSVLSKKYFTGTLPVAQIYFKPPAGWSTACVAIDLVNPNAVNGGIVDGNFSMTNTSCQGWYRYTAYYEDANLLFSNCPLFFNDPGAAYSALIPAGSLILYDFSNGIITNPPSCLNLGTNEADHITLISIFANPAEDYLELKTNLSLQEFAIYSAEGRKVLSGKLNNNRKIHISQLQSGKYILQLKTKHNRQHIIHFIKK